MAQMEDILEIYQRPYNPRVPVVCMDEQPAQLVQDVREPLAVKPGQPKREDYEYQREGVANIFMFSEPLGGWRHAKVREKRTKKDWAEEIRDLLEVHYPEAEKVCLVLDNLNTHRLGSLYTAFPPEEARRLAQRLEIHYTPVHGSWLNMAEIELSVLTQQCLDRRIPSQQTLAREVAAWEIKRNSDQKAVDWQFTTADARIKLKRLYPRIQVC